MDDVSASDSGWAIVENTSDNDWNDVQMVLVSGRPITYKMNLYEPLYIPRPMVEPELFASLRPPVYGGAMQQQDAWGPNAAAPPVPAPMAGYPPMRPPGMAGVREFLTRVKCSSPTTKSIPTWSVVSQQTQ